MRQSVTSETFMTKLLFSSASILVSALLGMVFISHSSVASAQSSSIPAMNQRENTSQFCTRLNNNVDKFLDKLSAGEVRINEQRNEQTTKLEARAKERADRLALNRSEWDKERQAQYEKLSVKDGASEEKEALLRFRTIREAAVAARRTAIDAAISAYQNGVKQVVADHSASQDRIRISYRTSVSTAFDKAKAGCAERLTPSSVRETLRSSLKSAREKLSAERGALEKVSVKVRTLGETRKFAVEKALADFKTQIDQARNDLKSVFGSGQNEAASSGD